MIYIIGNKSLNYYKIGYTLDSNTFDKRLKHYYTSTPFEFDYVRLFIGGYKTEKMIHRHFSKNHLAREWFAIKEKEKCFSCILRVYYQNDDRVKEYDSLKKEKELIFAKKFEQLKIINENKKLSNEEKARRYLINIKQ